MLDLRLRLLLLAGKLAGRGFHPDLTVEQLRGGYREMGRKFGARDPGGVVVRDLRIPAADGSENPARLYRPAGAPVVLPLLVYFHGGGWVIGDLDVYDGMLRRAARRGEIAVLACGYRLGPEHRFPASFEDGFAALRWVEASTADLGADPARIAVGGDSAGGAIAAALSTYGPERGLTRPAYQFLIYPAVSTDSARFPSRRAFSDGLPLTTQTMDWFEARFGDEARTYVGSPLMNVIDAPHPENTPPTYLLAARLDPLYDEGRAYADRLREAGVAVTYDLRPTLPHGLINFAGAIPAARRALDESIGAVAAALKEMP